jgi:intein/homing endonuclease
LVYTPAGYQTVGSILGDEKEVFTPIWDGSAWVNGRVFLSGKKQLRRTSVECGLSIDTSPDHRFLVVMDDGTLGWRDQDSLAEGDWVAINAIPVEGMGPVPTFKGREIDEDFMELMGWMTRDGTLVAPRYRSGGLLHLFYHPSKEQDIWERHSQMLSGWGLEHKHINKPLSLEEQSKRKQSCGAKSVEDRQVRNTVHNTDLVRWLIDQGFTTSAEGKSIPSMVFTLPVRLRQAFLRGFFSADGGKVNNTGSVAITIQADRLRSQTRQLLLSLGIRTLPCEGLLRAGFGREKTFSYKLFIKDRRQFWEQIGFIQPHKQLDKSPQKWSIGDLPAIMRDRFLRQCKDSKGFKKLTKSRRDTITACLKPGSKTNCSKEFLIRAMETCGLVIPTELTDKHYERVSQLEDLDLTVEMADVEMYSETHTFACQGFLVHNSNQEYKLQAHRDVGIRPLIAQWQDFINQAIFPLIDPQLAKFCSVKLVGLEAETAEKESIRLQQDMPVHMTFNDVLEQVEKDPVPVNVGGTFPLNPQWQAIVDKYVPVGVLLEQFFGIEGASQNPEWNYVRDPYFFQNREFNLQMQMMEQQAQAEQRAQAAGGPPPEEGEEEEGGGGEAAPQADPQAEQDLTRGLDQAIAILGKSENQLPPSKRRLLAQHRATVNNFMKEWEQDSQKFLREVMSLAEKHAPVHDKSEE